MKFGIADGATSSTSSSSSSSSGGEGEDEKPPLPPLHTLHPSRPARPLPSRFKPTPPPPTTTATAKPFNPPTIQLRPLPKPKKLNFRRKPIATRRFEFDGYDGESGPSDEDGEEGDSSDDSREEEGDDDKEEGEEDSDQDSEEEEWPVGPVGSIGVKGWRRSGTERGLKGGGADKIDKWERDEKATTWATANRTFHRSLSRALSLSPPPTHPSSSTSRKSSDLPSLQALLSSLSIAQSQAQTALHQSFEERNKALWSSIEESIAVAEREEKEVALREARRRTEEKEREAKRMREEEERKRKEEEVKATAERQKKEQDDEEKRKKAEEERQKSQRAASGSQPIAAPGTAEPGSPQAEWERWTAKMQEIKTQILPVVSQNPAYRKACFTAKRSITPKIGQLTASSSATLSIISALDSLLTSLRPPPTQPDAKEPFIWTLNHLSKALVKQAETEVTARLGTAFPLGRVVVGLILRGHTELGEVLMARLVKKCFWITGWWPFKQPGQSDEDHQKSLGHAPPTAGESLQQYSLRMSGYIALYASIIQTSPLLPPQGPAPPSTLSNIPPHFRPSAAWRLLVVLLRPPLVHLEPTPLLLVTFLEVAGKTMEDSFGRQWSKFLDVLLREGIRGNKGGWSEKSRGERVRLELWLDEWEKENGRVKPMKERECDP